MLISLFKTLSVLFHIFMIITDLQAVKDVGD